VHILGKPVFGNEVQSQALWSVAIENGDSLGLVVRNVDVNVQERRRLPSVQPLLKVIEFAAAL